MQKHLNAAQVSAFYHDDFVSQQVDHFKKIAYSTLSNKKFVVDVGGGYGYFASAIKSNFNVSVRLIDMDAASVCHAQSLGIPAVVGDATNPIKHDSDEIVCFNLILHHLVSDSEKTTRALQSQAIQAWRDTGIKIFVNEYIYESCFANCSGWLIFQITKSKFLSAIGKIVAKFIPSLHANTFGVGVRFRSHNEWRRIFSDIGFELTDSIKGDKEQVSMARRLLLIKEIRRDSFLLTYRQ